ncbi:MAG: Rrf2 family transcriptional regulator [bacterium]|nr:Rrf2 family transcriptional regulator [bacterium]
MLSASRKVDYGIMLMASLPEMGDQDYRSLKEIADERHLSAGFLSQVMMPLKKAGLVLAREGVYGGYQLAKPSTKITLSEIYEAIEGPLALTNCQNGANKCACESVCSTKMVWSDLQTLMNNYLEQRTLAQFRDRSLIPIL